MQSQQIRIGIWIKGVFEMTIETVQVRHIIPAEEKAIKNTVTEQYYPDGLYLAKGERASNYTEVDASEVPVPEPPENIPDSESPLESEEEE